jgi:hypothetical protein
LNIHLPSTSEKLGKDINSSAREPSTSKEPSNENRQRTKAKRKRR